MKLKKLTFEISGKEIELTSEEFEELKRYILKEYGDKKLSLPGKPICPSYLMSI